MERDKIKEKLGLKDNKDRRYNNLYLSIISFVVFSNILQLLLIPKDMTRLFNLQMDPVVIFITNLFFSPIISYFVIQLIKNFMETNFLQLEKAYKYGSYIFFGINTVILSYFGLILGFNVIALINVLIFDFMVYYYLIRN